MMEEKQDISGLSTHAKLRQFWKYVTVEPMFALYTVGYSVSALAMANLNLDKACRVSLQYNDTVCSALEERELTGYGDAEEAVQEVVTSMGVWKTFLQSIIPALLIPFMGSWSDRRRRRKPCMLLPLSGEIMTLSVFILCTYFFYQLPIEVTGFAEAFFPSITGGWMTMYMAVFSYLGDVTSVEERTLRIGIANICPSVSVTIGTVVSGILLQLLGYYGVFLISGVILILAMTFGCRIPESGRPSVKGEAHSSGPKNVVDFFYDFFDTKHLSETIKVAFKDGEHNQRLRVSLLLIVVIVVSGPWLGMIIYFAHT